MKIILLENHGASTLDYSWSLSSHEKSKNLTFATERNSTGTLADILGNACHWYFESGP